MGANLRVVKGRIKSVQSTKKITRAFELIAASQVVKAQHAMESSRPYAEALTVALSALATSQRDFIHPYLHVRKPVRNAAVVVITSDRGLAGPYSSSVLRQGEELLARLGDEQINPKLYVTGRKGGAYFRFRQRPVVQSWAGFSDRPTFDDAKEVANAVMDAFRSNQVDEIYVVYTHFVSAFSQRAVARKFLPLRVVEREIGEAPLPVYAYEPDAESVLDALLRRYIRFRLFSALLESSASELASRRRAMSTATDNATSLIEDLTRQYNQARQAEITQELMEVVGASEAFKSGSKR